MNFKLTGAAVMKLISPLGKFRLCALLTATILLAGLANKSTAGNIVGYVATWNGDPAFIQYGKLTHLNYSFAEVNTNGTLKCNTAYLGSIVSQAHAAGVKVLISVGGGSNGKSMTRAMRNARTNLIAHIEAFVQTWGLDGADIDWEAPENNSDGNLFTSTVQTLYTDLHPQGKLVTAALDTGDWFGMYIPTNAFAYLDLMNIMGYDSGGDYYFTSGLNYWLGRGAPPAKLMLGVGFFGNHSDSEKAYRDIVAGDTNAPYKEFSHHYKYNNLLAMQAKTQVAKYHAGGIMIWELSQDTDATGSTSLMNTIYDTMISSNYAPVGQIVSFCAQANSNYVSIANAGADALVANHTNASATEQFKVVDMGRHNVALLSVASGKYVTAANATTALAARQSIAGPTEIFTWQINADATVSLLSLASQEYVSADPTKGVPPHLWANRTAASRWEKFTVTEAVQLGSQTSQIRVVRNLPANLSHDFSEGE